MKIDAPQLENHSTIVSDDGRIAQFTLTNRAGDTLEFVLSYHQIGYFAGVIQNAAKLMQAGLRANAEATKAEMLAAFSQPLPITACLVGKTDGNPTLLLELEQGGLISVSMAPSLAAELMTALLQQKPANQTGH
jgi:hypothetical protein